MSDFDRTVKMFKDAINRKGKQPAPLDVQAVVQGLDGDTAWVTFAGSETGDTPVRRTIDCKPGDTVQVRSSGGKAWIVGNQSAPPTDDTKAEEVEKKTEKFAERIKSVEKVAGDAEEIANAVNQKVWSDEAGLHIADGKQDAAAERNSIWNSLGMLFRKGLNPILGVLTGDNPRVAIYDGHGSESRNEVANFGATSFVGRKDDYNISIAPENFELNSGSNNGSATLFRVGASGNPTSEIYQKTEVLEAQTELEDTPISGTTITILLEYFITLDLGSYNSEKISFTAGTSATKSWRKGTIEYTAPKSFAITGLDSVESMLTKNASYSTQADAIDLGILQFGSRQDGGVGNNSATIGNELVAPYSYQTVVGKHNAPINAPFVVGNGDPTANENALAVDWDGNLKVDSDVYINCNADSSGGKKIGENKVLWSGAWYMNDGQTVTLSENVSEQLTGIVLVWSYYTDNAAQDYGWHTFFVPKMMVQLKSGVGYDITLRRAKNAAFGTKYVYIYDNAIFGHADNVATGTANNVPYANNKWVLRYVFGC